MKKRLVCTLLLLALLCSLLASCSSSVIPCDTQTKETVGEAVKKEEKETKLSYPCETDPDFHVKDPKYENLSAEAVGKGGTLEIAVQISTGELLLIENLNF